MWHTGPRLRWNMICKRTNDRTVNGTRLIHLLSLSLFFHYPFGFLTKILKMHFDRKVFLMRSPPSWRFQLWIEFGEWPNGQLVGIRLDDGVPSLVAIVIIASTSNVAFLTFILNTYLDDQSSPIVDATKQKAKRREPTKCHLKMRFQTI